MGKAQADRSSDSPRRRSSGFSQAAWQMHFDDRLATVLRQPATGDVIARVQFRQLLDLLGTLPAEERSARVDLAYARLSRLSREIGAAERAQMLREAGLRLRNPRLLAQLADAEPPVAGAAIATAQLSEEQWLDLIPALPVRARGILRHRRDLGARVEERLERLGIRDRALPPAPVSQASHATAELPPEAENEPFELTEEAPEEEPAVLDPAIAARATSGATSGIGAIVRRIEEFRKEREPGEASVAAANDLADAPRLPLGDLDGEAPRPSQALSFDFASDPTGRITWATRELAAMLMGMRLGSTDPDEAIASSRRFALRQKRRMPVDGEVVSITGAPAVSGRWHIDAVPQFDSVTGQFTGYLGKARRPSPAPHRSVGTGQSEQDRTRQVLHELKTPANAIQMGAEVIQQQLYGPTPHEYRALAAAINSDIARILAGFEELDRIVRLETDALQLSDGNADLAATLASVVSRLQAHTAPRQSGFTLELAQETLPVAVEPGELEQTVWRLLAALAGAAAPGEFLRLRAGLAESEAEVLVDLPESLARLDDTALFEARADGQRQSIGGGMFGLGFTLRLAAAEAGAAGGALVRLGPAMRLSLPGLTEAAANLSQSSGELS